MPKIHIFNPDTDYALANNSEFYDAPKNVVELRRHYALLPSVYADKGDAILIIDNIRDSIQNLPYYENIAKKNLDIIFLNDANVLNNTARYSNYSPEPWGWNLSIRRIFLNNFGNMPGLPDSNIINNIRDLSHRRTTIEFLKFMKPHLANEIEIPIEIKSVDEALKEFNQRKNLYFKAPWSSSGRGIILTDDLEEKHVEPWVRGIIRRQGSVILEKAYNRIFDFATEWKITDSNANFIGYSVFKVSRRGKYQSNVDTSQEELEKIIAFKCPAWDSEFLKLQKYAIEKIVGKFYNGPLGIDMLVTESGAINPCVEINFRHTMGMLNLL